MNYLIVGLGNPGPDYELTRHNIGFLVLDRLAGLSSAEFRSVRHGDQALVKYKGRSLYLIKPSTFMNLSGKAVAHWLRELRIPRENLLVIVDDLALPFSHLRLKPRGSSAGHNGLGNIEETLGDQNYARLRFGIGNDFPKGRQVEYVLSNFSDDEMAGLVTAMDKAIEMVRSFATVGIDRTMNGFND